MLSSHFVSNSINLDYIGEKLDFYYLIKLNDHYISANVNRVSEQCQGIVLPGNYYHQDVYVILFVWLLAG